MRFPLRLRIVSKVIFLLSALAHICPPETALAQEVSSFENDIPFGVRMCFFRGPADSTQCLITITVDNGNLLFYRGEDYYESHYEAFLTMRENKSRFPVRGYWDKKVHVPSYDETTLDSHYDPLQKNLNVPPGKYEGFVEVKDIQANTYGNGRVSVTVPDFSKTFPKLSTPLFYQPEQEPRGDSLPPLPPPDETLHSASLKYPAGKPIFLLVDVYTDSTARPDGWKLTAEVVKELMVFPRIEVPLEESRFSQRKLIEVPTQTMGLGTYQIEVSLRDKHNTSLARATTFNFRIIKSAQWVEQNVQDDIRYLKFLVSPSELKRLLALPKEEQAAALKAFWDKMDPVPATAINELKVQYFERIEYANAHFTTEQHEGWETDMGEVYILLGPPSEIYGSRLNQIWVYERENLTLYFFNQNLRNRDVFDEYIRQRRWWKDSGEAR